jgi:hypothetical protein
MVGVVRSSFVVTFDPLAILMVVDTCVLQPSIATSGETASASQVLPKGPVVRAYWRVVRVEPLGLPLCQQMVPLPGSS